MLEINSFCIGSRSTFKREYTSIVPTMGPVIRMNWTATVATSISEQSTNEFTSFIQQICECRANGQNANAHQSPLRSEERQRDRGGERETERKRKKSNKKTMKSKWLKYRFTSFFYRSFFFIFLFCYSSLSCFISVAVRVCPSRERSWQQEKRIAVSSFAVLECEIPIN